MIDGNGLVSLEEVSREYDILLFEASAMIGPLPKKPKVSKRDPFKINKEFYNSLKFLEKAFEEIPNLHITPVVLEGVFGNGRVLPLILQPIYDKRNMEGSRLKRMNRKVSNKREDIYKYLRDNRKVIDIKGPEREIYSALRKKYNYLDKGDGLGYDRTRELIINATFALEEGRVAMFSNNFKMLYGWSDILNSEGISSGDFGFFNRMEDKLFKRMYPSKGNLPHKKI